VVGGVEFLGATLWTDFELLSVPGRPLLMSAAQAKDRMQRRMIDYSLIRWRDGPEPAPERLLTPDDSAQVHHRSRTWLADRLAIPFDGPRVVVTHHLPSWRSVAPSFLRAASNAGFASDLDELFGPMAFWFTDTPIIRSDYRAGSTRIIANPRGYPDEGGGYENPHFQPALLVEVGR
jgi:hypothetical protein